jgi:peptide/nickel transport system permease protein
MECVPDLGAGRRRLEAIPGLPPVVDNLPEGCAFAERCHKAQTVCREGRVTLDKTSAGRSVRCRFPGTPGTKAAE